MDGWMDGWMNGWVGASIIAWMGKRMKIMPQHEPMSYTRDREMNGGT